VYGYALHARALIIQTKVKVKTTRVAWRTGYRMPRARVIPVRKAIPRAL
jgi:hypothetical protein